MKVIKKLNKLIDMSCIRNLQGTLLYSGESTTGGTLTDDIGNFKRLKIFYRSNDTYINSTEVYNNNSNDFSAVILMGSVASDMWYYGKSARIIMRGASFTIDRQSEVDLNNTKPTIITFANAITVTRIEGYKY